MTPQLEDIIRKEAEKRMSIKSVGVENYQAGFEHGSSWMAEHMEKFADWMATENVRYEAEGYFKFWVKDKWGSVTTSQLIEKFFEHIKSKE